MTTIPFEPVLPLGTVVRVAPTGQRSPWPAEQLFVVIGDRNNGITYRLAVLGGDPQHRYQTGVARALLTVVPVTSINA
ncbi:hypothetical protein GCM10007977_110160 [Dactylosporangium sucinum]|uniref:Uncharacterized protein n=1 Tax=Dactylosporangium sucinum TaxID=1424081 RepID=A0A917UIM0_9ACTN|nr:hypothetical protein GCM10007977_110160 [Dactylosporangium sucinum]